VVTVVQGVVEFFRRKRLDDCVFPFAPAEKVNLSAAETAERVMLGVLRAIRSGVCR